MKIILHIGTEKTGTTAIQSYLHRNRNELLKNKIVPGCSVDRIFGRNHFALALASSASPGTGLLKYRNDEFRDYRQKVQNILDARLSGLDKDHIVVFSAEHLSSRLVTIEEITYLKSLFTNEVEFKIVCYLRPQHELLLGAQAESIKAGHSNLEFNDPRLTGPHHRYGSIYYDYDRMLGLWEDVFGLNSMFVTAYEKGEIVGSDVVVDFVARNLEARIPPELVAVEPDVNKRLSGEALFVLATLNSLQGSNPKENLKIVREFDDGKHNVLIEAARLQDFFNSFERENDKVAKRYMGRGKLFRRLNFEYEHYDFNNQSLILRSLAKYIRRSNRN